MSECALNDKSERLASPLSKASACMGRRDFLGVIEDGELFLQSVLHEEYMHSMGIEVIGCVFYKNVDTVTFGDYMFDLQTEVREIIGNVYQEIVPEIGKPLVLTSTLMVTLNHKLCVCMVDVVETFHIPPCKIFIAAQHNLFRCHDRYLLTVVFICLNPTSSQLSYDFVL